MNKSWKLTEESFARLLATFDPDRDRAGAAYESLHRKLVRFFEWRQCAAPEELADETMNRVAWKLDGGQEIGDPVSFIFGVARFVLKEHWKQPVGVEINPAVMSSATQIDDPSEQRLGCLEECLAALPATHANLVLRFYHFEGREKIRNRQKLADELRIPINALRIRVHRMREKLEACVGSCLERHTLGIKTSSG